MNWQTASEYLKSKIKKVGTHGGRISGAHVFYVGREKYHVHDSRKIDCYNIRNEHIWSTDTNDRTATEEVVAVYAGKGKRIHRAVISKAGLATACNPEKTEYAGEPVREAIGFGLSNVDCKVCLQTKGK